MANYYDDDEKTTRWDSEEVRRRSSGSNGGKRIQGSRFASSSGSRVQSGTGRGAQSDSGRSTGHSSGYGADSGRSTGHSSGYGADSGRNTGHSSGYGADSGRSTGPSSGYGTDSGRSTGYPSGYGADSGRSTGHSSGYGTDSGRSTGPSSGYGADSGRSTGYPPGFDFQLDDDFDSDDSFPINAPTHSHAETKGSSKSQMKSKKRRKRGPIRITFGIVRYWFCVILISAMLASIAWLLFNDLCAFNHPEATAVIEVTSEDTVDTVAQKLQDAGLIQYKWFFKLFADLSHADEKIGIGSYELNSDMDYRALITNMKNGSGSMNTDTVRVTIPEGYTVSQTINLMASKGVNTVEALTEAAESASFNYDYIEDSGGLTRLEGYLFPDTYDFYLNEDPANALNRLLHNFDNKMTEERLSLIENSEYSMSQILTIASLIEKETDGTDQKYIASVIYNRLNDDGSHGTYKYLQIDASLLYALPNHEGTITSEDKSTDSPYNLYQYKGLPPTPIANPGIAAIDAALEPAESDYYFYALATDGTHHFSETLEEHNAFLASSDYAGS